MKPLRKPKFPSTANEEAPVDVPVETSSISPPDENEGEDIPSKPNKDVSTNTMDKALALSSETFNLINKGYSLVAYSNGGSKGVKVTLSNKDFEVTVIIKDPESMLAGE